mgnify:CR=1 FL=1
MARSQSDCTVGPEGPQVTTLGRLAVRLGVVLTALSLPLGIAAGLVVVLSAPTITAGFDGVIAATSGPLGSPDGIGWLLHVAVLGLLTGTWLAGAGLVAAELID